MRRLITVQNGTFQLDLPIDQVRSALSRSTTLLWLDIEDPTQEDTKLLRDVFGFHPLAVEDAIRAHERPKVDAYGFVTPRLAESPGEPLAEEQEIEPGEPLGTGRYYFVVFYAAAYDSDEEHITIQAINLFIGSHYLVTVHNGPSPHIGETLARWQAPNGPLRHRVGALVYALLDALVDDYFPITDQIADRIDDLEGAIFERFDEGAIETIFGLKRDLLNLRRVVAPERDVINVLLRRELPVFRSRDVVYFQDIYDHLVRVTDNIDTYRDLLSSALDSYLSLQSNRLNQIVKLLTIGSILLMSMSLIAGIYGMNFKYMPELNQPWGYPWALGLMAAISTILIIIFRRRKWF